MWALARNLCMCTCLCVCCSHLTMVVCQPLIVSLCHQEEHRACFQGWISYKLRHGHRLLLSHILPKFAHCVRTDRRWATTERGHVTRAHFSREGGIAAMSAQIPNTTAAFEVTTQSILKACAGVTFITFHQYGRQYFKEAETPYLRKKEKEPCI